MSDNIVRCARPRKNGICDAIIGCVQPPKNGHERVSLSNCVTKIITPTRDAPSINTVMRNPKRYKRFLDSYYEHSHPEFMNAINAAALLAGNITKKGKNTSDVPTLTSNDDDSVATTSNEDITMATMPNDDIFVGLSPKMAISTKTISSEDISMAGSSFKKDSPTEIICNVDIPIATVQPTPRELATLVHEGTRTYWSDETPGPSNQQFDEYAHGQFDQNIDPLSNQNNDTLDDLISITTNPMMSNYSPPIVLEQTTFENIVNNLFDFFFFG